MITECEICEYRYIKNYDHNYTICPNCLDALDKSIDKNCKCSNCNGQMFNSGGTVGTKKDDPNHIESITCSDCGKSIEKINHKDCE